MGSGACERLSYSSGQACVPASPPASLAADQMPQREMLAPTVPEYGTLCLSFATLADLVRSQLACS